MGSRRFSKVSREWLDQLSERNPHLLDLAKSADAVTDSHMSEHAHQVKLVRCLTALESVCPDLYYVFAVPNGGWRAHTTAWRLKAEGQKAGVPDIKWDMPRGRYHGLYIELKAVQRNGQTNKPSENQKRWLKWLRNQGYYAVWACDYKNVLDIVLTYWALGEYETHGSSMDEFSATKTGLIRIAGVRHYLVARALSLI